MTKPLTDEELEAIAQAFNSGPHVAPGSATDCIRKLLAEVARLRGELKAAEDYACSMQHSITATAFEVTGDMLELKQEADRLREQNERLNTIIKEMPLDGEREAERLRLELNSKKLVVEPIWPDWEARWERLREWAKEARRILRGPYNDEWRGQWDAFTDMLTEMSRLEAEGGDRLRGENDALAKRVELYRRADLGHLFCWCVEHLKKFPPIQGEWTDEVERRLIEGEHMQSRWERLRAILAQEEERLSAKGGSTVGVQLALHWMSRLEAEGGDGN